MNATAIHPIRTEEDYRAALARIREIFHASDDSPEADELEVLTILVHDHERRTISIDPSDPVEEIRFTMDRLNLRPRDQSRTWGPAPEWPRSLVLVGR